MPHQLNKQLLLFFLELFALIKGNLSDCGLGYNVGVDYFIFCDNCFGRFGLAAREFEGLIYFQKLLALRTRAAAQELVTFFAKDIT